MADSTLFTVHHVFQLQPPAQGQTYAVAGLGDFLRGSISLWQIVHGLPGGASLELCTRNHPTLQHLLRPNVCTAASACEHKEPVPFFEWTVGSAGLRDFICTQRARGAKHVFLLTNVVPDGWPNVVSPACAEFMRECLLPTDILGDAIMQTLGDRARGAYDVLHIRAGDPVGSKHLPPYQRAAIGRIVRKHIAKNKRVVLVIADNAEVRDSVAAQHGLAVRINAQTCHLGDSRQFEPGALEAAKDTMVDFFLIAHAGQVFQISTGGTGFSDVPALLFHVPVQRWRI